jgi:hypothetical protein
MSSEIGPEQAKINAETKRIRELGGMQDHMDILITELERDERLCLDEYEHRRSSFVWSRTAARWQGKAQGIRHTIDVLSRCTET